MSDDNKSLINLIPASVDNAAKNITDLPTQGIGQTLSDCWFLIFGGISQLADKRRAKYAHSLEQYKKELETSLRTVPEEKRIEPSSQIVLSALDESKYCVEEEELRKLFVSLLTSATDSRKRVHPSFPSIIRQMSPSDALLLRSFGDTDALPICDIKLQYAGGHYKTLAQNICLPISPEVSERQLSLSASALVYLGICRIPEGLFMNDNSVYEPFKEFATYKSLLQMQFDGKIELQNKVLQLTPLGKSFIECCLT
ncbi:MAG: DUF4393 domain-containing protein [Lachnospiraceae bacterium]|nr:DUF4393 domain-containing protein [Lachnospiraceae bacterium]